MEDRDFNELRRAREDEGKFVCVGLDPQFRFVNEFPSDVPGSAIDEMLVNFLLPIVEATADIAAWYKPNFAYFLQHGWQGVMALETLYREMRRLAEGCVFVHDAKNGDIGDTNAGYVSFAFDKLQADAVTLHNYMGMEAMLPFLKRGAKGCFVLARTSNEGANEFQGQRVSLQGDPDKLYNYDEQHWPLYSFAAHRIARAWNFNDNCGVVAGASTSSIDDLAAVRAKIRDGVPILCPGVGKQGGSAAEAYRLGSDAQGKSIGINSSSGITHAHRKPEYEGLHWAEAARAEVLKLHEEITAAHKAA